MKKNLFLEFFYVNNLHKVLQTLCLQQIKKFALDARFKEIYSNKKGRKGPYIV